MSAPEWAHKLAERIAADVRNRHGLGNEWDGIDDDIQDEIVEEWASLIAAPLPGGVERGDET